MQALTLPAMQGWRWMVDGFRLFRRNAPLLTFLVFGYLFALLALDLIPMVGPVAASLCVPVLSVGVMNGCRGMERNADIRLGVLFSGFRTNPRTMVALGGIYLVGSVAILALAAVLGGGELLRLFREGGELDSETLDASKIFLTLQIALALTIPFLMAFWYAPMLSAWHGCSAAKALFFSFVACQRNWRAFLIYGLAVAGLGVVVPGILLGAAAAVSAAGARFAAGLVSVPLLFLLAPTLFASFYVSYRDVFVAGPAGAPTE